MGKKQMQIIVNLGRFHSLQGKSIQRKWELMTWKNKKNERKNLRLNYNVVEIDRLQCFFHLKSKYIRFGMLQFRNFQLFGQ